MTDPDMTALIDRWSANGTISAAQAARMRADVAALAPSRAVAAPAGRGTSLVTEALGYLGGVIILVASGLVTGWFWPDMSAAGRLGLVGGVAALLLVAGAAVSRRLGAPGDRLRSALWLLASAAIAGFLVLLFAETLEEWNRDGRTMLATAGTALVSAILWTIHPRVLQHIATFVPVVFGVGVGTDLLEREGPLAGLAIVGIGTIWALLAWGSILDARRQGVILGSIAMVLGAMTLVGDGWGTPVALLVVAGLVAAAILFRDLVLLVVASAGVLWVLPVTMTTYFSGVLGAALALLIVGMVLIGAAVLTARRRREQPPATGRTWSEGTAAAALIGAVAVAAIVVAVIALSPTESRLFL